MSGEFTGVAARLKKDYPKANYIHCYAYQLNLCLKAACQDIVSCSDTIAIVNKIYNFFNTAKRHAILNNIQSTLEQEENDQIDE